MPGLALDERTGGASQRSHIALSWVSRKLSYHRERRQDRDEDDDDMEWRCRGMKSSHERDLKETSNQTLDPDPVGRIDDHNSEDSH